MNCELESENLGFRAQTPCVQVEEHFYMPQVPESELQRVCNQLSWAGYRDVEYEMEGSLDRKVGEPIFTVSADRSVCACHTLPPARPAPPALPRTALPTTDDHKQDRKSRRKKKNSERGTRNNDSAGAEKPDAAGAD